MTRHSEGKAIMGLVGIICALPVLYTLREERKIKPVQPVTSHIETEIEKHCRLNAKRGWYETCIEQETYCVAAPKLYCEKRNYKGTLRR